MAFIEIKILLDKNKEDSITINTGFIYKIFRDTKNLTHSIIAYDYDYENTDTVIEDYESLVKRIQDAEDGVEDEDPSIL